MVCLGPSLIRSSCYETQAILDWVFKPLPALIENLPMVQYDGKKLHVTKKQKTYDFGFDYGLPSISNALKMTPLSLNDYMKTL